MTELPFRARAFGYNWASDIDLARFDAGEDPLAQGAFRVERISALPTRSPISQKGKGFVFADGCRFVWGSIAVFDVRFDRHIDYLTLDGWDGRLPDAFFSTVAALAVAGAGMIPMHASAVEIDGRAFLFAGDAGAGKSTLVAELLAQGGCLLSDDLTVLYPPDGDQGFRVTRGRPSMRLHPGAAALVDMEACETVSEDTRGKLLVRPRRRAADSLYPLAGIFLLAPGPARVDPLEALQLLPTQIFRPSWMARLPVRGQHRAWLIDMAAKIPVKRLAMLEIHNAEARERRVASVLAAIKG